MKTRPQLLRYLAVLLIGATPFINGMFQACVIPLEMDTNDSQLREISVM